jgi:hypothetical protein
MNDGHPDDPGASIKQIGVVRGDVWERFDRLQRTVSRLRPPSGVSRGVYRFTTHAEQNEWEWTNRLKNLEPPANPTW